VIGRLEQPVGTDLDRDGRVGWIPGRAAILFRHGTVDRMSLDTGGEDLSWVSCS